MSRLLRFCMITTFYPPYNFGGDGIFVRQLAHELARRGHHVEVIHCADSYRLLTGREPQACDPDHPGDVSPPLSGVVSPRYGEIPSVGWGSGRTGEHTDDAWALVVPRRSRLAPPRRRPHIVDIPATVCAALGVDATGLDGAPLLAPADR